MGTSKENQIIFRVSDDTLRAISLDASRNGYDNINKYAKETFEARVRSGKINLSPETQSLVDSYERKLAVSEARIKELESANALNGFVVNEKTVEERVNDVLAKRDFEETKKVLTKLEKEKDQLEDQVAAYETEVAELQKGLGFVAIAEKLGPGIINGLANKFPKIAEGLAGMMMGALPESASISDEDQAKIEFHDAFKVGFTDEDMKGISTLCFYFRSNKQLIPKFLQVIHNMQQPAAQTV